eukprot:g1790.t1
MQPASAVAKPPSKKRSSKLRAKLSAATKNQLERWATECPPAQIPGLLARLSGETGDTAEQKRILLKRHAEHHMLIVEFDHEAQKGNLSTATSSAFVVCKEAWSERREMYYCPIARVFFRLDDRYGVSHVYSNEQSEEMVLAERDALPIAGVAADADESVDDEEQEDEDPGSTADRGRSPVRSAKGSKRSTAYASSPEVLSPVVEDAGDILIPHQPVKDVWRRVGDAGNRDATDHHSHTHVRARPSTASGLLARASGARSSSPPPPGGLIPGLKAHDAAASSANQNYDLEQDEKERGRPAAEQGPLQAASRAAKTVVISESVPLLLPYASTSDGGTHSDVPVRCLLNYPALILDNKLLAKMSPALRFQTGLQAALDEVFGFHKPVDEDEDESGGGTFVKGSASSSAFHYHRAYAKNIGVQALRLTAVSSLHGYPANKQKPAGHHLHNTHSVSWRSRFVADFIVNQGNDAVLQGSVFADSFHCQGVSSAASSSNGSTMNNYASNPATGCNEEEDNTARYVREFPSSVHITQMHDTAGVVRQIAAFVRQQFRSARDEVFQNSFLGRQQQSQHYSRELLRTSAGGYHKQPFDWTGARGKLGLDVKHATVNFFLMGVPKSNPERKSANFVTNKGSMQVRIQPLALTTILDAFARKPKKESRAIGTLMGLIGEGNILEIVDAFQVVHSDSQISERGVLMDQNYHSKFVKLRQHVHPKEQVVGWFSVGEEHAIDDTTQSIHGFYRSKESKFARTADFRDPIYLQVDTTIRDQTMPMEIKVYTSSEVPGTEKNLLHFYELPTIDCEPATPEMAIIQRLAQAKQAPNGEFQLASSADTFSRQLGELRSLFTLAREYIADVQDGKKNANPEVGRALMRALEANVVGDEKKMDGLIEGATQDVLMCRYLSSLCNGQIVLAERVQQLLSSGGGNADDR